MFSVLTLGYFAAVSTYNLKKDGYYVVNLLLILILLNRILIFMGE